jgi:toxin CcdB
MAQFTVYRNKSARTKAIFPFLLDVQSDLLQELQTRVVIPLSKIASLNKRPLTQLTPILQFENDQYMLMTPQLAGIAQGDLGAPAGSLTEFRDAIVAALDFLIVGF